MGSGGGDRHRRELRGLGLSGSHRRAVFAGTSDFAATCLRRLLEVSDVVAVVTQPDRPGDRGRPAPRPVADLAREHGIALQQPPRLRAPEAQAAVLECAADVLVVAAYGQIVPSAILEAHRLGGVNVHASLLPRWRGAAPIAAAIRHGDPEVGVAIMRMEAGLDTGPVFAQRSMPTPPRADTPALSRALAEMGAALLLEVLATLTGDSPTPTPQPEAGVTVAPRLRREDGIVDWSQHSALDIDRMIRAYQPWPGTHARLAGETVRLWSGEALVEATGEQPATILGVARGTARVATCDGVLRLDEVQPPGRRRMPAADYIRGRRIPGA